MEPLILEHFIDKSKEGSYYAIPFPVPEGVEELSIAYSYSRSGGSCVDLGLSDGQGRFLGWSGSARQQVVVGPHSATPGYRMTAIEAGPWSILVGAYHIPAEGLPVRYEITFRSPGPRWLRGDLHVHSTASDGQHDAYTLARRAKKLGLDFLAIADHNNYCENYHLPVIPGLTMIPAVEWTHYRGHVNFFGAVAPFENSFIANDPEEMRALIRQVKQTGALVSVNHPKCSLCPCLWEDEEFFQMAEVWNGPMRPDNQKAIAWWHSLLCRGRRIPIVGGSDFHRDKGPVRFAHPTTWVYADSPAPEDICRALSQGRSYISASPKGVRLEIAGGVCFGAEVPRQPGRLWRFRATGGNPGMVLRLVTQQGTAAQVRFSPKGVAQLEVTEDAWDFAYLQAGYLMGSGLFVRAISNPVYFRSCL